MSQTLADLSSLLDSEFLLQNNNNNNKPLFSYDFASSSSTESESEDDELTHRFTRSFSLQDRLKSPYPHLQNKRVFSGSPESTLTWPVSGSTQVRSSPATPFLQPEEDAWELIYAAAGQVARMKMNMKIINDDVFANGALFIPPRLHNHPNSTIWRNGNGNEELINQQYFRNRLAGTPLYGGRCRQMGFRQSAWPPVENQCRQLPSNTFFTKPVPGPVAGCGRTPVVKKRECAGTGVFLPRRYNNDLPEPKKKPACSPANLPARVAQSYNKNVGPMNPPNIHVRAGCYDYGMVVAGGGGRRNGGGGESAEVVLPQEWTY